MKNFFKSKTNLMALFTIGTAIAKMFGVDIPTEIFIGEAGLIALFLRLGISKVDAKLSGPMTF